MPIFNLLHLFSFKTPILLDKNKKNVKSIVGISPIKDESSLVKYLQIP
jgi:hypothetical protein